MKLSSREQKNMNAIPLCLDQGNMFKSLSLACQRFCKSIERLSEVKGNS